MANYTNESPQSTNKKDMVPILVSSELNEANNKVLEKTRKLNHRLVNMERQCWTNAQYSRRECLDITDIPSDVEADVLEEKVVNIFEKFGCNIPCNHIEACHRVSKKSATVTVKFSRRKDY